MEYALRFIRQIIVLVGRGVDNLSSIVAPDANGRHRGVVRWLLGTSFALLIAVALELFEIQTRYVYFLTLEHRLKVLQELNELAKNDVLSHSDLAPIYQQIAHDLFVNGKVYTMNLNFISSFLLNIWTPLFPVKFVAGSLLGIMIVFGTLLLTKDKYDREHMLRGALRVTYISGIIGALVPYTALTLGANLLLYASVFFVVQLLLLSTIGRRSLNSRGTPPSSGSTKDPAVG